MALLASLSVCGTPTYIRAAWSAPLLAGTCSNTSTPLDINILPKNGTLPGIITCALNSATRTYRLPPGIFELDIQLLVPERTSISGAKSPNDASDPARSPKWSEQTLFLATRGATDYLTPYCFADDMVTTRVGFVLSSHVTMRDLSYQGVDTIRPDDNGGLCGGGAFETKGCARNDCGSDVNNGGGDGVGSAHVTIQNVRLNDFYYSADATKVGIA